MVMGNHREQEHFCLCGQRRSEEEVLAKTLQEGEGRHVQRMRKNIPDGSPADAEVLR